jgi:hypothetical protein
MLDTGLNLKFVPSLFASVRGILGCAAKWSATVCRRIWASPVLVPLVDWSNHCPCSSVIWPPGRKFKLNIHLEDPVSTKTVRCELHKCNIHGRAAIAKPLITESNDQMGDGVPSRPQNLDIRQLETRTWYGHISRPSRCFLQQEEFTFGEHPRKPTIRNAWFKEWNTGEVLWWFGQQYRGNVSVPLLPFMAELLQGSTWTGWVIRCIPLFRRYFRTVMQFSKTTVSPFTQLELFSHGLKSMKVNFSIFRGQHNYQIWTSLNHSGEFWRLEWVTDSHLQRP